MKIAVVEPVARGGMIHYAFQMCRALAAAGAEVTLVTSQYYELAQIEHRFRLVRLLQLWDPKPAGRVSTGRIARFFRRLRRVPRALRHYREWLRLIGFLRRERPDVTQFGDIRFATDLPFLWLLRVLGFRLADVCHNIHPFATGGRRAGLVHRSAWSRSIYRRIYRQFDTVFVHFETNRPAFMSAFRLDAARTVCIPHGNQEIFQALKDETVTAATLRARLDLGAQDKVVLLFGTLSRYKGIILLMEAFEQVRRIEPAARLVLAGFPAADFRLDEHRSLARRLGIEPSVRFVPEYVEVGEVAAWMNLASVVVFPYQTVFQSGALHLALTFGAPIVATRVGAIQEVVVDGQTGLIVQPEDPKALADAIAQLLRDPTLAADLGSRAYADARTRFGWDAVASAVIAHYGSTFADRHRASVALDRKLGAG